jgi:hypothetical protein
MMLSSLSASVTQANMPQSQMLYKAHLPAKLGFWALYTDKKSLITMQCYAGKGFFVAWWKGARWKKDQEYEELFILLEPSPAIE